MEIVIELLLLYFYFLSVIKGIDPLRNFISPKCYDYEHFIHFALFHQHIYALLILIIIHCYIIKYIKPSPLVRWHIFFLKVYF